jgi:hypothetical protein
MTKNGQLELDVHASKEYQRTGQQSLKRKEEKRTEEAIKMHTSHSAHC